MATNKPTFDIFGPPSKNDIKVGYISTTRGMVEGVTICEANRYAVKNPGTTFIFKPKRDKIKFLTINEVNRLTPSDIDQKTCPVDSESTDSIQMTSSTDTPPKVVFMGGGGVGVSANPIIGEDGSVLAVDVVSKGLGYQYPPIVEVRDDLGIGAGAVTRAVLGETEEQMIYYDDKEDYEVYELCEDIFTSSPGMSDGGKDSYSPTTKRRSAYGRRWTPEGKDLGKWIPQSYTNDSDQQFELVITEYIKKLNQAGKDWFTTRKNNPLKVTSVGFSSRTFYKVKHSAWSDFMNKYAISPKPPSNAPGSDFAGNWYTFEWDQEFPYDGEYIFRGARDNVAKFYIQNKFISDLDNFKGKVSPIKKTLKKGTKKLRLELYNEPVMETVYKTQPPPPSTSDVVFKITSGSMFSNGFTIEELNINEVKPFTPPEMGQKGQLNVSHTRKIEFGKKYKVVFTSKSKPQEGESKGYSIQYSGLKLPTDKRFANAKRLEFDDDSGNGFDVNASFTIDSGDAKFSPDGVKLIGSGLVKLTYSWNDNPRTSGTALNSIKIGSTTWTHLKRRRGSETRTVDLGPKEGASSGANTSNIKLRTKGSNVIQMEDHTDNDWTDIICSASTGQFTDLKDNIAYFSVPFPSKNGGKSGGSQNIKTRRIFNTVDYIDKANRELWRTNVYNRGGFLNDYGVCPFDTAITLKTNPYAGTHKIVWPNVDFPIDGNYTIKVAVDDNVDLKIGSDVTINKKGFIEGSSVGTGTLKVTKYIKKGRHNITADLFQQPGGSFGFRKPDGKEVMMNDVTFKVTTSADYANSITIPGLFSLGKTYKGAQLNQSISRKVETGKEYDVRLSSVQGRPKLKIVDNGKKLMMEDGGGSDWNDLVCTATNGIFHSIKGDSCKFSIEKTVKGINPMALAIDIQTEFTQKEVQSRKSWNENPMGAALTIEAPLPPIPQQPIPQQEGRCPNNPFWTTRFPGAKERWYPVRHEGWGSLLNKHGISPLPPFANQGVSKRNDEGSFTNTWTKEFPYGGFYKVKMEADDIAELWIDDDKVLSLDRKKRKTFDEKLVYISGPTTPEETPESHTIKVVVENFKSARKKKIDQKVFSTVDWMSGSAAKAEIKNVRFKITSASMFANSIRIDELGIFERKEFTPGNFGQINVTREREVEVNKIYDVEFFSSSKGRIGTRTNSKKIKYNNLHSANKSIRVTRKGKRIELMDGHGNDTNFALDIDRGNVKFDSDGRTLLIKGEEAKITASWSDNPGKAGVAVDSIQIGDTKWTRKGRRGSETHILQFATAPVGSDNTANIKLRNKGESIVQMEDLPSEIADWDWQDMVCAASKGRFFDFNGNKCKYMIPASTNVQGGISGSTTKNGVTYEGPHLFHYQDNRWGKIINREGVSPISTPSQKLNESNDNILGKKILRWDNVDFPQTSDYQITFLADNGAVLLIDGKKVLSSRSHTLNEYTSDVVKVDKGKHNIQIELTNALEGGNIFLNNPTGVALRIYTKVFAGTGTFKSWQENPMGVSAKLIPPPCPKKVKGKGIISEVIVDDPGNGFPRGEGDGYPVALKIKKIRIKDPGINYDCAKDTIRLEPSMGSELKLVCGPFGRIKEVVVIDPGLGFTKTPQVIIESDGSPGSPTGVNLDIGMTFEVVRDPIVDDPDKLIQVTDLVGLKQTGYYRGRPYYGSVFYQNGIRYAGWYETAGELVQIYDTMQESIDAQVTTPASAILRQGSDVSSNDPRLNIPGTPENLT